ncbi:uncharacterized protein LOC134709252 [Mytilus trossulus]|uniref:uncharacterized protein LOC134709252 n=1 Tax=Mytilus trossulus TaxID=6551 RepID=UPI00300517F5
MTKLLLILIVAIAVLASVEAESFECMKKRQKAHQSPSENYHDYLMEQILRENGIEIEKEPSKEECEKERELDRQKQKSYRGSNKVRSISELLYLVWGFIIVAVIIFASMIPIVLLVVYVDNKYDIIPARVKTPLFQNGGVTEEEYQEFLEELAEIENISIEIRNRKKASDKMWKL